MTTLNEKLTKAHPWLSEEKAHWLLQTRVHAFNTEVGLDDPQLGHALTKATYVYQQMSEQDLRSTIARFEEHYFDPIQHEVYSSSSIN